jgi:hypothetical protein
MQSKFALAVEIDKDLYEIFEIFFFDKESKISQRYDQATSNGAIGIVAPDHNNLDIGSILVDNKFITNSQKDIVSFAENDAVYTLLSENKVFAIITIDKNKDLFAKYDAAFESNVIVLNVSNKNSVGMGDIWDASKKIILKYEKG